MFAFEMMKRKVTIDRTGKLNKTSKITRGNREFTELDQIGKLKKEETTV